MKSLPLSILFIGSIGFTALATENTSRPSIEKSSYADGYDHNSFVSKRAKQNWQLNCQGCHMPSGRGRPDAGMPDLNGIVAKFLTVDGGREYLMQVPGIVNAMSPDQELAELIDWTLITFDPDNIPFNHKQFSGEEIAKFRKQPLATKAHIKREALINEINRTYKSGDNE